VNIGYTVTMVGKRYFLAQNITANEIAGYNEHTATLWREFKFNKCKFRLQGEIINLTDAQYNVIMYYPMPGRSWRITGTISF
jgi:outer membrane cobalamin receptor